MTTVVSQKFYLDFARWMLANGADTRSSTELLEATKNKTPILGGRINNVINNSDISFREGFLDKAKKQFGQEKVHEILSLPEVGVTYYE